MTRMTNLFLGLYLFSYLYVHAPILIADEYAAARKEMVELIATDVKNTSLYLNTETLTSRVMQAMATVPRHEFVPEHEQSFAYENRPLPIGYGQTISQPYIVAIMTELLNVTPQSKVLELGTGSGYQSAILAGLVDRVYTIEIIKPLGAMATERMQRLGYDNVQVKIGDGYYGWKEYAPYDAIVVTAAGSHIPPHLIEQLKVGGRMIIPVGGRFTPQQLLLVEKKEDGKIVNKQILPVRFVPLTGKH